MLWADADDRRPGYALGGAGKSPSGVRSVPFSTAPSIVFTARRCWPSAENTDAGGFPRRAELGEAALRQHADAVGDAQRFARVVGHENRRRAGAPEQIDRLLTNLIAKPRVQARERFVHQQDPRLRRERARQRHPLPFTAREHVRVAVRAIARSDIVQQRRDGAVDLGAIAIECRMRHCLDRQVRKQREVLKDHADAAPLWLDETPSPATTWLDRDPPEVGRSRPAIRRSTEDFPSRTIQAGRGCSRQRRRMRRRPGL